MTKESFSSSVFLKDLYTPLATSTNPENVTFIANFEAKKYPFWGVQFHPGHIFSL
jgi:anthranilate/para-aminobenzoate synthase component II